MAQVLNVEEALGYSYSIKYLKDLTYQLNELNGASDWSISWGGTTRTLRKSDFSDAFMKPFDPKGGGDVFVKDDVAKTVLKFFKEAVVGSTTVKVTLMSGGYSKRKRNRFAIYCPPNHCRVKG